MRLLHDYCARHATVSIGAVGVVASMAPIIALVGGHLAVGFGAAIGVEAMLSAAAAATPANLSFVTLVERIFGLWGYVAAWLL